MVPRPTTNDGSVIQPVATSHGREVRPKLEVEEEQQRNRLEAVPESEELTAEVVERCRVEGESIWVSIGKPEGVGRLPKDGDREHGDQNNNEGKRGGKDGGDETVEESSSMFATLAGTDE